MVTKRSSSPAKRGGKKKNPKGRRDERRAPRASPRTGESPRLPTGRDDESLKHDKSIAWKHTTFKLVPDRPADGESSSICVLNGDAPVARVGLAPYGRVIYVMNLHFNSSASWRERHLAAVMLLANITAAAVAIGAAVFAHGVQSKGLSIILRARGGFKANPDLRGSFHWSSESGLGFPARFPTRPQKKRRTARPKRN